MDPHYYSHFVQLKHVLLHLGLGSFRDARANLSCEVAHQVLDDLEFQYIRGLLN